MTLLLFLCVCVCVGFSDSNVIIIYIYLISFLFFSFFSFSLFADQIIKLRCGGAVVVLLHYAAVCMSSVVCNRDDANTAKKELKFFPQDF